VQAVRFLLWAVILSVGVFGGLAAGISGTLAWATGVKRIRLDSDHRDAGAEGIASATGTD
jgi:hypothetical protein